jgi:hypothetical protein
MTAAWIAVLAVGVATVAIKGAGTLVFADRPLPRALAGVMPLLAPALLAALVVGQTAADGRALVADARLAGVAAAAPPRTLPQCRSSTAATACFGSSAAARASVAPSIRPASSSPRRA